MRVSISPPIQFHTYVHLRMGSSGRGAHCCRAMSLAIKSSAKRSASGADLLLLCGLASALVYVSTDLAAAAAYPGYSLTDQAVSELFAIGAPTSIFVVPLFSLSSALLLLFARGIVLSEPGSRNRRLLGAMFSASAIVSLLLWNFFPMHLRGAERTFTDTMHLLLATNPFVWATLLVSIVTFKNRLRWISIAAFLLVILPAVFSFRYAASLDAGLATPGLGLAERAAQYSYELWQFALALTLVRNARPSLPAPVG
jgi:hypothetical protein